MSQILCNFKKHKIELFIVVGIELSIVVVSALLTKVI
jgi:hypothetical protein